MEFINLIKKIFRKKICKKFNNDFLQEENKKMKSK